MTSLALLTKESIDLAITEFDQLGRDTFIAAYGGRKSKSYFVRNNGRLYDTKPIVAAALSLAMGKPIKCSDFSGGDATIKPALESLGFAVEVRAVVSAESVFRPGALYNRRRDIHAIFGGQERGGIATPASSKTIFLFTGESGKNHGYHDGWDNAGTIFRFYGEGRIGNMVMAKGNFAIATHMDKSKSLLLFEATKAKGQYRYLGEFVCQGHMQDVNEGADGKSRTAIVFLLSRIDEVSVATEPEIKAEIVALTLEQLRELAIADASNGKKSVVEAPKTAEVRRRSAIIKAYALRRAAGVCEECTSPAPFVTSDGEPYLEVHHLTRLADDGPDHPFSVAAICPTCHRRIHFGADGQVVNERLRNSIRALEGH